MDPEIIQEINKQVWLKFPYLKKAQPVLKSLPDQSTLLRYSGESKTANGQVIPIMVKVKAAADGKILQMSSSR